MRCAVRSKQLNPELRIWKGNKAKEKNLRLLATLPFEPEIVKEGNAGDISLLDNDGLLITQEFDKLVDEIVKLTKGHTPSLGHNRKRISQAG